MPRPGASGAEKGGTALSDSPRKLGLLKIAIVLALIFDVLAGIVLVRAKPIAFTLFMFLAQPLFAVAVLLLAGVVLTELQGKRSP